MDIKKLRDEIERLRKDKKALVSALLKVREKAGPDYIPEDEIEDWLNDLWDIANKGLRNGRGQK